MAWAWAQLVLGGAPAGISSSPPFCSVGRTPAPSIIVLSRPCRCCTVEEKDGMESLDFPGWWVATRCLCRSILRRLLGISSKLFHHDSAYLQQQSYVARCYSSLGLGVGKGFSMRPPCYYCLDPQTLISIPNSEAWWRASAALQSTTETYIFVFLLTSTYRSVPSRHEERCDP